MNLQLEPIKENEDPDDDRFASPDCQQLIKAYQAFYPEHGYHPPWIGYFVLLDQQIAGSCGFTGQPANGRVELAYWTFKAFEGKGIAGFACRALVNIAVKTDPSLIITAKTAPEKNASVSILEKNGFVFSGIVQDHEIGDAWEWILAGTHDAQSS